MKTDEHTSGLSQEMSETGQQTSLKDEIMAGMKDHVNKLEKEHNETVPQTASLADVVRMPDLTLNFLQTPSSAERLDKLEYAASEEDRQRKLFQVKITHPGLSNASTDPQTHVKQFFSQQLNMPSR